jgi:ACS family hexuronate transporter-like MFS transporter
MNGMRERRVGYRWTICALLFAATTLNYVDRQVLGVLGPTLQHDLHWTETQYGDIVSWFSLPYAIAFLFVGRWLDRVGVRRGLAASVVAWSIAAIAHAFARTTAGFSLARAALGLTESANFPGSIKSVAEWFPPRERALATGLFNAGTNMGAIAAPIMVPWIALTWGWRWAFVVTGSLGFLWVIVWLAVYRAPDAHPDVTTAELELIRAGRGVEDAVAVPWLSLLRQRQTWAFIVGKLMSDPIWWFYLFWFPKFLDTRYGVKLSQVMWPLIAVYLVADIGSIGGGWFSSAMIKHGYTVNRARKTAMLAMALLIVPTSFAPYAANMWLAVALVAVAAAAHQGWSANVYTLASDMFPSSAVASVIGIGGFVSGLGAWGFQRLTGRILQGNGSNYAPIFLVCGLAYVTAWLIIHMIAPRLEPAMSSRTK